MSRPAVVSSAAELRQLTAPWRSAGQRIALVPTMGNLHDGHLQLCELASRLAERVIVTIFVNPTQFGPGEDYESYPRTPEEDIEALHESGCTDVVFAPPVSEIYPNGTDQAVQLSMPALSGELCGASRPGHFAGVAGVVLRLANLTRPDILVFGEKDYQQLVLIKWLVADLRLCIEVVGMPISRADDGLALSSRNRYLGAEERARAPLLHRELEAVAAAVRESTDEFAVLEARAARSLAAAGFSVDYVAIRHADDLRTVSRSDAGEALVVLGAATLGRARLIDNVRI